MRSNFSRIFFYQRCFCPLNNESIDGRQFDSCCVCWLVSKRLFTSTMFQTCQTKPVQRKRRLYTGAVGSIAMCLSLNKYNWHDCLLRRSPSLWNNSVWLSRLSWPDGYKQCFWTLQLVVEGVIIVFQSDCDLKEDITHSVYVKLFYISF